MGFFGKTITWLKEKWACLLKCTVRCAARLFVLTHVVGKLVLKLGDMGVLKLSARFKNCKCLKQFVSKKACIVSTIVVVGEVAYWYMGSGKGCGMCPFSSGGA
jgi:hypothetical protein